MIGPIMLEQHIKCQLLEQTILIACQLSSIFVDLNSSINKQRIIWMDALTGPSYAFNWVQICFATALAENYFNLLLTSEYCCRWFRIISVAGFKLFLPWGLELCSYPHLVIKLLSKLLVSVHTGLKNFFVWTCFSHWTGLCSWIQYYLFELICSHWTRLSSWVENYLCKIIGPLRNSNFACTGFQLIFIVGLSCF